MQTTQTCDFLYFTNEEVRMEGCRDHQRGFVLPFVSLVCVLLSFGRTCCFFHVLLVLHHDAGAEGLD